MDSIIDNCRALIWRYRKDKGKHPDYIIAGMHLYSLIRNGCSTSNSMFIHADEHGKITISGVQLISSQQIEDSALIPVSK